MNRRLVIVGLILAGGIALGATAWLRADWTFSPATDKWSHVQTKDPSAETRDTHFQRAVEAYQAGKYDLAERLIESWRRAYGATQDEQYALFLLGQVRQAKGDFDSAYETYESLLDRHSGTDLFDRVLACETEMAKGYLNGKKRKIFRMFWVSAQDEGQTMLEKIFRHDPRGVRGKAALLTLADYHFREGKFGEAEDEYQRLITNYPKDADVPQLKLLAAQAALGRFRGVKTDSRSLSDAEQRFRFLKEDHPDIARKEQVDLVMDGIKERKAEKDYDIADFYRRTNKEKGAIFYYRAVIKNYPRTVWADKARGRLAAMGVDEAPDPTSPPSVARAGIGLPAVAPATANRNGPRTTVAIGGTPMAVSQLGSEDTPPIVLWAGPAPVLRDFGAEGVIVIGAVDDDPMPDLADASYARRLGDVAEPASQPGKSSTSQPEGGNDR